MTTGKPGKPENYSDTQLKKILIEFRKKIMVLFHS